MNLVHYMSLDHCSLTYGCNEVWVESYVDEAQENASLSHTTVPNYQHLVRIVVWFFCHSFSLSQRMYGDYRVSTDYGGAESKHRAR